MALRALKRRPDDHAAIVVSTPEDEARLRALIEAELDRRYAKPLARRTLALMAEAALEPASEPPGYRVVDRHGDARFRPAASDAGSGKKEGAGKKRGAEAQAEDEPLIPVSLADLVAELREVHPTLFSEPPPEPEAEPAPHAMHETMEHVRAASARFVESQSALVRSLAHSSAEGSRALASAAGERFGFLRARLKTRRDPAPVAGPLPDALPAAEGTAMVRTGTIETVLPRGPFARLRSARTRSAEAANRAPERAERRERAYGRMAALAGGGVLGLALIVGAGLLIRREPPAAPDPAPTISGPATSVPQGAADPQQGAPSPSSQATAQPVPPGGAADPELQPSEAEEPPQNANALTGVPEVIDTATLRVSGKLVPLFGVEWVRGGQADELKKYLAGRSVSCQPAPGSSAFLCAVEGRDLSEVVLFNGGGRASSEATPDLVAAEDHARGERLGVWKR